MLCSVIEFVRGAGLDVEIHAGASGFVPGVQIEHGTLLVDPSVCEPGNLLHEAGHIAITPGNFRHFMSGDLSKGMAIMYDRLEELHLDPEHPIVRACIQCSDPEATAWAWSAGRAIGVPPRVIIGDQWYGNTGADIRIALELGCYLGINGLAAAGFCSLRNVQPLPKYPHLAFWVQPHFDIAAAIPSLAANKAY